MPTNAPLDDLLRRGRAASWWPFLAAGVLLMGLFAYGAAIWETIPDQIPLHYGARGEPTRWGEKSIGSVFFPLLMSAASLFVLPVISAVLPMFMTIPEDASAWTRLRVEGSTRGTRSGLGWTALLVVALTGWLSVQTWRGEDLTGTWLVAFFILGIFVVLWLAYRRWATWARRTAEMHGIHPTPEEEAEDRLWLPMGIYTNPDDPRVMVPKRAGYGVGSTINVGHPKGRALAIGLLAVSVVPMLLIVLFAP